MQDAKIARREAAAFEQRDSQRVAEHELHRRRRGWRKAVRAGLVGSRQGEADVGLAAERALRARGHGDERNGVASGEGDDRREFDRLARPGQGEYDIAALQHAEVAVARLGRMDEGGGLTGRGERRRDLAGDVAGLAHASDDDAAARRGDRLHRLQEGVAEAAPGGPAHRCRRARRARAVRCRGFGAPRARRRPVRESCGSLPPRRARQNRRAARERRLRRPCGRSRA